MANGALKNLGRYRILSELGRGAMGIVYKAEDPQLERTVAIKTIQMSSDSHEVAEYLARFRQEAKALGGLSHPGIIAVFDFGREEDVAYMAMEYIDGVELRDLMAASRLPMRLIIDLTAQIADGLAFAHERGVVHRDIKPANIMVVQGERAKIMDFGIARVRVSDVKTQTGTRLGSPKYMSPEQVVGRPVDHRSDLFSLGVILYEMLAGIAPFSGADISQLMFQVVNANPSPPSRINPAVPEMLDFIVAKALEKDPENRYQSASELAIDLRMCRDALADEPPRVEIGGDTLPLGDNEQNTGAITSTSERTVPLGAAVASQSPAPSINPNATMAAAMAMATATGATTLAGASLGLLPSRKFDSTLALARLARPSASDRELLSPTVSAVGGLRRIRQDTNLLGRLGIWSVATIIAFCIAFI